MKLIVRLTLLLTTLSFNQFIFSQLNGGIGGVGGIGGGQDYSSGTEKVHKPPHNGTLTNSGKYEIEMVHDHLAMTDPLVFYIYKANHKVVLNQDITGTIVFTKKDGKLVNQKLNPKGNNRFVSQIPDANITTCLVEFQIGKKKYKAIFTINHHHDHNH